LAKANNATPMAAAALPLKAHCIWPLTPAHTAGAGETAGQDANALQNPHTPGQHQQDPRNRQNLFHDAPHFERCRHGFINPLNTVCNIPPFL
jgi:hypothetical protein